MLKALLYVLCVVSLSFAEGPVLDLPRTPTTQLKKYKSLPSPIYSQDRSICVMAASADRSAYRHSLLKATTLQQEKLATFLRTPIASETSAMIIRIGDETNAVKVISVKRINEGEGFSTYRISIPNPDTCDLDAFQYAVTKVFLLQRAEACRVQCVFPAWFIRGITRAAINLTPAKDYDDTWRYWLLFQVPSFSASFTMEGETWLYAHPQVAALWARWVRERLGDRSFDQLLTLLWQPQKIAPLLIGNTKLVGPPETIADRVWDSWIQAQSTVVTEPGAIAQGILSRWSAHLVEIDPSDGATLTPRWVLEHAQEPKARAIAERKLSEVLVSAMGSSLKMTQLAKEYSAFFQAVTLGKPAQELDAILSRAEASHRALVTQLNAISSQSKTQKTTETPTSEPLFLETQP